MSVAKIILEQLGGRRFTVMTGAKHFVGSDTALSFTLPGGGGFCKDGINSVRINLDPSDTYTVSFYRVRKGIPVLISSASDVYCDVLRDVFESATGLRTSL